MTDPLPDRWADEPWPLDDPVPAPSFRPANWSDTHDNPPQVADLADEAWQRAVDKGISIERALAELQQMRVRRDRLGSFIPVSRELLDDLRKSYGGGQVYSHSFIAGEIRRIQEEDRTRQIGDLALQQVKHRPLIDPWKWDRAVLDQWDGGE